MALHCGAKRCQLCKVCHQVHCKTGGRPLLAALLVQRNRRAHSVALQRAGAALVDVDSVPCDDAALLSELAALKATSLVTLPALVEAAPELEAPGLDPAAGDPWDGAPRRSEFAAGGQS